MSAASSKKRMRTTSSATSRRSTRGFSPPAPRSCGAGYRVRAATMRKASITSPVSSPVRSRIGCRSRTVPPEAIEEVLGVNDRVQLAALERFHQRRLAEALMREGASLADPARVDIRGRVRTGRDVFIDVNVVFEGDVVLGDRVSIGPGCIIKDTVIEQDTEVRAHCIIEGAHVGIACRVGPFARLRTDTQLSRGVHIGDFVELKNATLGEGSKANPPHLHRGQPDRPRRQRRRGSRHLQLRRREQAHDGDRRQRLHRLGSDAGGAGHRPRRRDDRSGDRPSGRTRRPMPSR